MTKTMMRRQGNNTFFLACAAMVINTYLSIYVCKMIRHREKDH